MTTVPSVAPKQLAGVAAIVPVNIVGSVKVIELVVVQPFPSVTVTLYVPAAKPVAVEPV